MENAKSFADQFADTIGGMGLGFDAEDLKRYHKPVEVKECADKRELAEWFTNFARACRSILPRPDASQ